EATDHGLDITPGTQGRVHLVVGVERAEPLVGEREMVGAGLGGDLDPASLALADQLDGASRRDVLDVQPAARDLGEADVAGDHDVLGGVWHAGKSESHRLETLVHDAANGELGHLAVLHDHAVEHLGVLEGAAHQGSRGDRRAVVGEGHGTTGDKLTKSRQFFALAALAHGAYGIDVGLASALALEHDKLGRGLAVDGGNRVGHAGHRCHPSRQGGRGTRGDGLILLVAWLSQVDVNVDQPGAYDQSAGIDDDLGLFVACPGRQHVATADPEIADLVAVPAGVDDPAPRNLDGWQG